ncbi:MAG TPA: carboxypeptidase-like regulatory domain-containing protein [Bryobacteraceae bacterium]|jgi:hypothetical protein
MMQFRKLTLAVMCGLFALPAVFGQATDGSVTGAVLDPSGAAVVGATVTAQNIATGVRASDKTDSAGSYRIDHLLVGSYSLTATSTGFSTKTLDKVAIELNKIATVNIKLEVGNISQVVEISETAAAIDTSTAQVANSYTSQMTNDLAITANPAGGVLNLSLLGAGVGSSGGVGIGIGPSIGGQRPRNNSFNIEGIDNNRKDVTGPVVSVPNDAVAEFTVLQNQFSAEYGHSSGGQFNSVLDNGTNNIHGGIWEYLENRNLNAIDQNFARLYPVGPVPQNPRFDQNRLGAKIGGPIKKNKLFYFGSYEYNPLGQSPAAGLIYSPTAAGYSALSGISTFNTANYNILKTYLPAAPTQSGSKTISVCNAPLPISPIGNTAACPATNQVSIPIGILPVVAPNFQNVYRYVVSVDYNLSDKDQLRGRYVDNKTATIDTTAELPVFFTPLPITGHLGSFAEYHNFSPNVNNEFRLSYNRYNSNYGVPNFQFPGLDQFPNLVFNDLNSVQLGPGPNDPQATIQNTYSLVDNVSLIRGRHEFKFGIDARDLIAASTFIQRSRGDYEYNNLSNYLHDISPDYIAQRNVGGRPYSGNQTAFYAFANDNYKVDSHLTVNIGVRYEFNGVAQSMKLFDLDAAASTPGLITFAAPKSQKGNFAPRIGFAYSPGDSAKTSIRGGFGIAYDQIFDNVGTNATPPQASATVNADPNQYPTGGFLANGGILPTALAANPTVAQLKALSTNYLPNQEVGYAINWNFGVQHVFAKDYTLEVRYLGNRGVHLIFQNQLNKVSLVSPSHSLPIFFTAPTAATLDALPLSLATLQTNSNAANNMWYPYGYTNAITGYLPIGNSSYEGLATEFTKRYSAHVLFKAAYTWSHLIDDSTAEVNSTALTPRRPQDFQNINAERATSALDHRNRFTLTSLYDVPWFSGDRNWFKKNIIGNVQFSFVYTAETGELATPQSAVDANLNGDSATDRVIINPNGGFANSSTDVTALRATSGPNAGQIVAYQANNPYALYVRAAAGMYANSGRNLLLMPAINNLDFNAVKVFTVREGMKFELRADFFNGLNHPQYTAGAVNNTNQTQRVGLTTPLTPGNALFDAWDQVLSSHPRNIQVGAKLTF